MIQHYFGSFLCVYMFVPIMDTDMDVHPDTEATRDYVQSALSTIGLDESFRSLDATDSGSNKIEVAPGVVADPNNHGFDVDVEDDPEETFEWIHWKTTHLVSTLSEIAHQTIESAELETVGSVVEAEHAVSGEGDDDLPVDPVLVLPGRVMTTIGIPGSTCITFDQNSMEPEVGLYVDRTFFGFRVDGSPLEVLEYRDEAEDQDMQHVRMRRDYVVTNPDAGVWVDFSQ